MQVRYGLRSGRLDRPALAQKLFDFSTLRGGKGAAEAGAFQRRGGGGEPQRLAGAPDFR